MSKMYVMAESVILCPHVGINPYTLSGCFLDMDY